MAIYLICNNCRWAGSPEERVSLLENIEDKAYCPICDSDDFKEEDDFEEEDEVMFGLILGFGMLR